MQCILVHCALLVLDMRRAEVDRKEDRSAHNVCHAAVHHLWVQTARPQVYCDVLLYCHEAEAKSREARSAELRTETRAETREKGAETSAGRALDAHERPAKSCAEAESRTPRRQCRDQSASRAEQRLE